jgi:hypothetical protein
MTNNIDPSASLTARIDLFISKVRGNETELHAVAIDCLQHSIDYGNCSPADRLRRGMGKKNGYGRALQIWFEKFSPIRWNGDDKVGILPSSSPKFVPYNMPEALTTPVMELAPDLPPYELNESRILQALMGLKRKADRAANGDAAITVKGNLSQIQAKINAAIQAVAN